MDRFRTSCDKAAKFPRNLIYHDSYGHNLSAYSKRLDERESDLFSPEEDAALDLQEYDSRTNDFKSFSKTNVKELQDYLINNEPRRCRASCRYVFLHAPNSRDRLYTSRRMLTYILTYYQVMPSILDFIFPFGRQEHARDFYFSGFRQESRLEPIYKRLQIPELGRSGRELRMCYSLKSVETSEYQPSFPWSIRQTAVYHTLDIETGASFWIILKGDELIRERIEDAAELSGSSSLLDGHEENGSALAASLATHMIICDWCGEDWRWYISYLEESIQDKTRHTLAVMVDSPVSPIQEKPTKSVTWSTQASGHTEKRTIRSNSFFSLKSEKSRQAPTEASGPPPPMGPPRRSNSTYTQLGLPMSPSKFSFADLQQVQLVEDRANEVLLILESNINVLQELQEHYQTVTKSGQFAQEVIRDYERDMERFEKRIISITNDLRTQQSRTRTLLRLLADRKSLLYGILEYQNMQASKMLALKAQQSTENMEVMTKDMHILAQKTKQETVSMRIITLVTLFFLPGTFISVSLLQLYFRSSPTIMSTDIVQFQTDSTGASKKIFQLGALQLFLTICLPMMVTTFAAWYGVYWWVNRKEEMKRRSQLGLEGQP